MFVTSQSLDKSKTETETSTELSSAQNVTKSLLGGTATAKSQVRLNIIRYDVDNNTFLG